MSINHRLDLTSLDVGKVSLPLDGSTAVTKDTLYYSDRTNKVVKAVTSTAGWTTSSLWLATRTVGSGATSAEFIPVLHAMLFECDTTANTASTQLMIRHAMTDSGTINNTTSDVATTLGIFEALSIMGAASTKKLVGRFISLGQLATST